MQNFVRSSTRKKRPWIEFSSSTDIDQSEVDIMAFTKKNVFLWWCANTSGSCLAPGLNDGKLLKSDDNGSSRGRLWFMAQNALSRRLSRETTVSMRLISSSIIIFRIWGRMSHHNAVTGCHRHKFSVKFVMVGNFCVCLSLFLSLEHRTWLNFLRFYTSQTAGFPFRKKRKEKKSGSAQN